MSAQAGHLAFQKTTGICITDNTCGTHHSKRPQVVVLQIIHGNSP